MTIRETLELYRNKQLNPCDVIRECRRNFETRDGSLNAVITPMFDEALETAQGMKFDESKPLWGIPIAIKDNIAVKGFPLSCGSKILQGYKSLFDATATEKLKDAGALIVAKTNMDEFAMGSSGEYSAFGPTKNPLNEALVPGGSSSGSAVAVAADYAMASLGSDTGGSVRQPAAFCGLVGIRPTYGTVSRYGLVAFTSSIDQIGPLARTVDDASLVLKAIRGLDPCDSTSVEWRPAQTNGKMVIGIPKELGLLAVDGEIMARMDEAKKLLESKGATFIEVSLPNIIYSISTYQLITPSECSANLSRFDGVRYGLQVPQDELDKQYKETRSKGFGDEVKRRILIGTYALSEGYFDAFYLQACRMRRKIYSELARALESCQAIITPTTPTTAFPLGSVQGPLAMYACDMLTIPHGLAGMPAISVPFGADSKDRPIGMQIAGPAFSDDYILEIGRMLEVR